MSLKLIPLAAALALSVAVLGHASIAHAKKGKDDIKSEVPPFGLEDSFDDRQRRDDDSSNNSGSGGSGSSNSGSDDYRSAYDRDDDDDDDLDRSEDAAKSSGQADDSARVSPFDPLDRFR